MRHSLLPSPLSLLRASILSVCLFAVLGFRPVVAGPVQRAASRLYVDFSDAPSPIALISRDVCFLDAKAGAEFGDGKALGHQYFARINLLQVAPGSQEGARAGHAGIVMNAAASNWDGLLLDVLHPQWQEWVIERLAKPAAGCGFTGLLLEGAGMLSQLDALRPAQAEAHRKAFCETIAALRERFPDLRIALRGDLDLALLAHASLDAVLLENLLGSLAPAGAPSPAEIALRKLQSHGVRIYAVEHGHPADLVGNRAAAERLERLGCVPFITTADMNGVALGPILPQARHTLVLHGWDPAQAGRARDKSQNTWTAQQLEPVLKWMDLAPRYVDVTQWLQADPAPERLLHPLPAAVVLDPSLTLPEAKQVRFAQWLSQAKASGIPILLLGQPFQSELAWKEAAAILHLGGSGQSLPAGARASVAACEAAWFRPGTLPDLRPGPALDLQAPAGSTLVLSHRVTGSADAEAGFDSCFIAPWGGAWIAGANRAPLDPFKFLQAALQRATAGPVPDTTTLAGRQIYLSTVQGRGFCDRSWLPGTPLCGESLLAELKEFPGLPVTIALAEADVRGWSADSDPAQAVQYESMARALFALPQVEPASNSMSRPADWGAEAFRPGDLRPLIPERRAGIDREIAGSIDYFKRRLVPPGKRLKFFLWPEGAEPGPAALDHLAQCGLSQLPGSWLPGWNLAPQAPAAATIDDTPPAAFPLPHSADAIAAEWLGLHAPAAGAPRLAPVHLAYSFADLKHSATRDALRQIWTWCDSQPLHPMTASSYAAFAADAAAIQVYPNGENRWLVAGPGRPATLRLPAERGVPDMLRSRGVTGYSLHAGQVYIHLGSHRLCEVVIRSGFEPQQHLRLVEADRPVEFYQIAADSALLRAQSRDATVVTLGGLVPGAWYDISASSSSARLQADEGGQLALRAPALTTVRVQLGTATAKPYAAR